MDPTVPEPPGSPRLFRPRSVGEILLHALELYRLHWQNLIVLVAVVVIPLSLTEVLLTEAWIEGNLRDVEVRGGVEVVTGGALAAALVGTLVIVLFSILIYTALTGAISRAAAGTFLGRDMDIAESYRFGLARFGSILLVGLLSGLAILGGFILLVVPGFIVLTRLTVTIQVLVVEDVRGTAALKRSWNLVKGHSWPVFGTIVVAGILTSIVSSILTAPFDELTARSIASAIAAVITTPYTALVGVLLYLDLRIRKEGYGPADLERDLARSI